MKTQKKHATSGNRRRVLPRQQWTPPEGLFLLKNAELLKGMRLEKYEWLGIYPTPAPGAELLYASQSPLELYRKLRHFPNWPIAAMRAKSKDDLSPLWPAQDHFLWLRQRAFTAIGEARKRIENRYGLYDDAERKQAKDFLRDLGNEARREGKQRGDKPQVAENEMMLCMLYELSRGKSLKEITIDKYPSENYEKKMRSLSVRIVRFSERVAKAFCSQTGCGTMPASIRQPGAHERCWVYLAGMFGNIERWPGVQSNRRDHGYALCEALRQYKPNAETPVARKFQQL